MTAVRLIHFTDPHLYSSEAGQLRGIATYPSLANALAHAREHHWNSLSAVLVTGDIVQDDPGGYVHFHRLFGDLDRPVLCLPGNHDVPEALRREISGPPFQVGGWADFGAWRVVLLDSCIPGSASGALSATELALLDQSLATAGGRHVLVCLHHHPIEMASRWLDYVGLENAAEFFKIIDGHRNVRAILWGHVHQNFDGLRKGVRLLATPSTCAQFLPGSDEFALDALPPAYRMLELRDNGSLLTDVIWMDEWAAASLQSGSSAA